MTQYRRIHRAIIRFVAASALCTTAYLGCDGRIYGGFPDSDAAGQDSSPQADASPAPDAVIDECLGQPVVDWYLDSDGDSYGDPQNVVQSCGPIIGYVDNAADCDDTRDAVNPGANEICGDSLDNDCQGGDPCDLSMIAHWRFDEGNGDSAADATGNGHTANLVNTGWNGAGDAANFDGTDGYVEVEHSSDFEVNQGSVALWFRTRSEIVDQGIWSKDSSDYDTGGHLNIRIDHDDVDMTGNQLVVRMQSIDADGIGESHYMSLPSVEANTWYHLVVNFGSNGMSLWVNAAMRDSDPWQGGLGATPNGVGNKEPIAMGASTHLSGDLIVEPTVQHLNGLIRDVRFFDRSLIFSEIQDIYNNPLP